MAFKDVFKKIFPFISTAASFGGPLGTMAAAAVGKAIGVDKVEPTTDGVSNAVAIAMADPAQREMLIKAEQEFKLQMATLGFENVETLEKIAADDRASARQRETDVKDWMPKALGSGIVGGFLLAVFFILTGHGKVESALAGTLIGYLSAKAELVAAYYFGSSAGSARKTELLSGSTNGN